VSPPEPVASLATVVVTRPAMRRYASVWAVDIELRKLKAYRVPRVLVCLKATAVVP